MLEIKLERKPKRGATIIEGFPGFGLVGTITTEFLIKHLNAKPIGFIQVEDVQPMIAVHGGQPVQPLGIFYDEKNNIMILHALANISGLEWKLADRISALFKMVKAKELISIEGVGTGRPGVEIEESEEIKAFCVSNNKKLAQLASPLKEGIVTGVSGALLLKKDIPKSFIFAEAHSELPDSRAAAKIIEILDRYLGLKVDFKPLINQAEKVEIKIKEILQKAQQSQATADTKKPTYFG
ncbi:proteasome assembly chaperone family protein [Candidatus Woesearchaeota archaeon]|nr:proteasome assembly chaperone family protein [Candidatus Woesearchaeota archaeon]